MFHKLFPPYCCFYLYYFFTFHYTYNPSARIIDLISHTTYVVFVNFIHKWRDLQFEVDSERQIFWETFHNNFICSQNFCQKSAERKSSKKYFLYFVLMSGLELEPFFWEGFSWQAYLLSEFLSEIFWEEIVEEIPFLFRFDVWLGARTHFLRSVFMAGLFTLRVFARNLLSGIRQRNTFFIFRFDAFTSKTRDGQLDRGKWYPQVDWRGFRE